MSNDSGKPALHKFESLHNFRDLGGLPTRDGGQTRYGVLFRSDSFHEASPADINYLLHTARIRSIIDLRSEHEVAADSTNALIPTEIRYHHFPIAGGPGGAVEGAPTGERLAARYIEYVERHTDSVLGAVRAIAETEGAASVVHCRVGKDRTGVVIALVLDTVGVISEEIAKDYELTTAAMVKLMTQLKASPTYAANVKRLPDEMYSSQAPTMTSFLKQMSARYGGATSFLLKQGLPQSAIDALKTHLLIKGQ